MIICRIFFIIFLTLGIFSITQTTGLAGTSNIPNVVTADIQAGIEHYIEEQTRLGDGFFKLQYNEKELRLKLVRVHTEYLANLGPRYHFACVDVADIEGDLYDVDFFLAGDPGSMTVTETTVHKINGQPFYTWEQQEDKTWHRVSIENAPKNLLGVLSGHDEFDFLYMATLPEITGSARMWLPLPTSDAFQTVEVISMEIPGKSQILKDQEYGNQVLFVNLEKEDSNKNVELLFHVRRIEKDAYVEPQTASEKYLRPNRLVPLNEDFKSIAEKVVKGKNGDLVRARALYDYVIDNMSYIRNGEGWGQGDATYACNVKTGNCTDFHSYFIALSRSISIPARFSIGASIPSSRNEGGIHSYHCGAEFYAEGKWWPVDISEADKYSNLASYFFGRHPANRIELSRGRDLVVEPGPATGPINFLAFPVLEIGGKPAKVKVQFSFNRNVVCE
ncbi:MAG: transglutaminase domain-containing protein [Candidatus Scalindua sp.]|nr:transglutaminase domain-containing protein [Candidatus Scalindua sp.]MBT7210361.1 transglutaminase domain-containing protein [Candidatus Scalindua sp.]MBT7591194.1 transglutaminase domain-containing protein [Candidatus Scalindua sp.]